MASHLHWADYLIIAIFFVISLAIGVYHLLTGGKQTTVDEFIMGDRRLKVIPTAISLLVSFYSAVVMLGLAAEMYLYGVQLMLFAIITPTISVFIVERFIVPWLYPLKLTSVFDCWCASTVPFWPSLMCAPVASMQTEYLEQRFMSRSVRIFGASLGIIWGVLFMGVAMYAPSAALESVTGVPLSVSIPVMAVVSVAYTALGGMRAVIWTDVFQFITMIIGTIAIVVKGLILVGGIRNVFHLAGEEGRLIWADFSFDPRERHTVWSLGVGMGVACVGGYGLMQASVQRFSAVDTLAKARATILLNIPPAIVMNVLSCIIGLIVLAYYSSIKCDPLENGDIANPNMLLSYFVVTIFVDSPGFAGLFLATLYGGALSTMSSSLSGSAANCWEDILKYKLSHLPEARKTLINRLLVVLFGVLSTGVAFLTATVPGPITQVAMAMSSSVSGPMMALFLLGAVSKHANWKGTLLGGIVGLVITFWLCFGSMTVSDLHPPLPPVSVEHCSVGNGNSTFLPNSLNYTNYTSFEFADAISSNENWNGTNDNLPESRFQVKHQLHGIDNFYAMSYMWFVPFGAMLTIVVGIIASFIMRDRDLEAKVDERLLLRFYGCGCSDENQNEDNLDDKNIGSIQETEPLNGPENGSLLNDVEMTSLRKTENETHKEMKSDQKDETKNSLLKNEDP